MFSRSFIWLHFHLMHLQISHHHFNLQSCLPSLIKVLLRHKLLSIPLLHLHYFLKHLRNHFHQLVHFHNFDLELLEANNFHLYFQLFHRISIQVDWEQLNLKVTYMYFMRRYSFFVLSSH